MIKHYLCNKNFFFLILILFTASNAISQQNDQKKIEKLQKKYPYVSKQSDKQTFLVAENPQTNNQTIFVYENIKVVTIDGKVIKQKEFAPYKLALTIGDKYEYFPYLHCFIDANKKIGIITTNGDIILSPTYDRINHFNSKGQAIAFSGTEIQVINIEGKPLLTGKYKSNSDDRNLYWGYTPDQIYRYTVIDNNLICSLDEKHYGIVNVLTNKTVAPFEYDKIGNLPVINEKDTIGYVAIKNNLSTILDFKTKKELAPFSFEKIYKAFPFNNSLYIEGVNNGKTTYNLNYYDVKNKKMIFKNGISLEKATPYDQTFWVYKKDDISRLYNTVTNETVQTPEEANEIYKLTDNLALYTIYKGDKKLSWIFDVIKNKVVKNYNSVVQADSFTLKNNAISRQYFFIKEDSKANNMSISMYDGNLKTYFSDLTFYTSYIESDRIIFKEEIDGKYLYTAYGADGNVIGKIREYKMK